MLSVIVPVFNEELALPRFLEMIDDWDYPCEVVFCDGGSTDNTVSLLEGRKVVWGGDGRGADLQHGVDLSTGENLLFLHVDCYIEEKALSAVEQSLADGTKWGCLTIDFDSHEAHYRFGIWKSNLRAKVGGTPFGDQGMFMSRTALEHVGGIPKLQLMEDYELSRRLRRHFGWPRQLSNIVTASVRRFESGNPTLIGIKMGVLRGLYRLGMSQEHLMGIYGHVR